MLNLSRLNPNLKLWKKKDYFIFLILIPAVLLLTYLLPENIQNYLTLHVSAPSLFSIFFSNYVHVDLLHFLGNLLSYLIVIFLLFNLETNKNIFYKSSFLIFIILPFISSFLVIRYLPSALPPSLGFSAIVAAFMGYLVYSAFAYIKKYYCPQTNIFLIYLILIINLMMVAYNLSTPDIFQIIIVLILVILFYFNRIVIKEVGKQMVIKFKNRLTQNLIKSLVYNYLLFLASFYFIFFLPYLIPSKIILGKSIINIFAHYIGYLFGLFVPIIIEKLSNNSIIQS